MGQLGVGACSDIGKVRFRNEDSLLIFEDQPLKIFAVADGMGGHKGGSVASSLALTILKSYPYDKTCLLDSLHAAVKKANDEILKKSRETEELSGMGTTLTAIFSYEERLIIAHVGDSRAYLYRQGDLQQLTEDHSLVEELLKKGEITADEAINNPQRHILMQALGLEDTVKIEIREVVCQDNDKYLLCTDGLTDLVSDLEIANFLATEHNLEEQAKNLVELANNRGGFDNITVIIINKQSGLGGQ